MQHLKYLIAVLGLAAAAVSAQPAGPPHGGPGGHGGPPNMERLTILLDLDTYQQGEVERILREQRAAMMAAREDLAAAGERPSFEEMQARREQNRQEVLSKLQSVLTEQQITKFKVLMERPEGRADRRGRPPAAE